MPEILTQVIEGYQSKRAQLESIEDTVERARLEGVVEGMRSVLLSLGITGIEVTTDQGSTSVAPENESEVIKIPLPEVVVVNRQELEALGDDFKGKLIGYGHSLERAALETPAELGVVTWAQGNQAWLEGASSVLRAIGLGQTVDRLIQAVFPDSQPDGAGIVPIPRSGAYSAPYPYVYPYSNLAQPGGE